MLGTSVEHMIVRCLRKIPNGIHSQFCTSVSSKWRLSRLTRGCTENDFYSVGWVLSWIQIRDQRSNCRLKWRGRLCNYILHEFFADRTYFLGQCGAEHHDLFAMWRASKYFLYISAHICNIIIVQMTILFKKNTLKK